MPLSQPYWGSTQCSRKKSILLFAICGCPGWRASIVIRFFLRDNLWCEKEQKLSLLYRGEIESEFVSVASPVVYISNASITPNSFKIMKLKEPQPDRFQSGGGGSPATKHCNRQMVWHDSHQRPRRAVIRLHHYRCYSVPSKNKNCRRKMTEKN